jgi:hypothetical protein
MTPPPVPGRGPYPPAAPAAPVRPARPPRPPAARRARPPPAAPARRPPRPPGAPPAPPASGCPAHAPHVVPALGLARRGRPPRRRGVGAITPTSCHRGASGWAGWLSRCARVGPAVRPRGACRPPASGCPARAPHVVPALGLARWLRTPTSSLSRYPGTHVVPSWGLCPGPATPRRVVEGAGGVPGCLPCRAVPESGRDSLSVGCCLMRCVR